MAGSGVSVLFTPNTPGPPFAGIGAVEDGDFVNGTGFPAGNPRRMTPRRDTFWPPGAIGKALAGGGDTTGHGNNLLMRDLTIQRVTLYRYR